jgi:histidyl-tRNA synthetase
LAKLQFQAVRGMNDTVPAQIPYWHKLEHVLRDVASRYGYQEIRFPIVEPTALFERSIGQATDIIEKEMFTFADRDDVSLALRPEGTVGCVRAGLEQGLLHNQIQRFWYMGPMFRYEKPQQGRYRQFHQFGVEAFGMAEPDIDAEQICLSARIWNELGLGDQIKLQINSLGNSESRTRYREQLVAYFTQHQELLDADSKRRLVANPLRILDSKNPHMQELINNAPKLVNFLDDTAREHFTRLQKLLDAAGISYEINPHLVRGLDYYSFTVYEWIATGLGAQNAVCAGGRYDALVEQLGGSATPAVGFAMGLERLIVLLETAKIEQTLPDIYLVMVGSAATAMGLPLAEKIRSVMPALKITVDCTGGGFKNQFKRADKSGAKFALIIGDDEVINNSVAVKNLRSGEEQQTMAITEVISFLQKRVD